MTFSSSLPRLPAPFTLTTNVLLNRVHLTASDQEKCHLTDIITVPLRSVDYLCVRELHISLSLLVSASSIHRAIRAPHFSCCLWPVSLHWLLPSPRLSFICRYLTQLAICNHEQPWNARDPASEHEQLRTHEIIFFFASSHSLCMLVKTYTSSVSYLYLLVYWKEKTKCLTSSSSCLLSVFLSPCPSFYACLLELSFGWCEKKKKEKETKKLPRWPIDVQHAWGEREKEPRKRKTWRMCLSKHW